MSPALGLTSTDRVVLFDGVCKLCNGWARMLIRWDRHRHFQLASVQSESGQRIHAYYGFPTHHFDTMLVIDRGRVWQRSDAFLLVVRQLPWPWPVLAAGAIIPRVVRDWLYDRIAQNRYRLFGRYPTCMLPIPDHASRFLP